MPQVTLWIQGHPKAQPRARSGYSFKTNKSFSYEDGSADFWKRTIVTELKPHIPPNPLDEPVRIDCAFIFYRPKYLTTRRSSSEFVPLTVKPDRDNLDKALLDSLVHSGFIKDDKIVFEGFIQKFYCRKESPQQGLLLRISWGNNNFKLFTEMPS